MSSLAEPLGARAAPGKGAAARERAARDARPWSLRRRVLLVTASITVVAWLVGGIAMFMVSRHVSDALFDQRLRALARRQGGKDDMLLECGPLMLSRSEHIAMWSGTRVELTKREYRILDTLLRNRDRILSRKQLEEALYGWGEEVESNAIEVHVHNLRRKLSRGLIETVRGAGYRLNANVEPG